MKEFWWLSTRSRGSNKQTNKAVFVCHMFSKAELLFAAQSGVLVVYIINRRSVLYMKYLGWYFQGQCYREVWFIQKLLCILYLLKCWTVCSQIWQLKYPLKITGRVWVAVLKSKCLNREDLCISVVSLELQRLRAVQSGQTFVIFWTQAFCDRTSYSVKVKNSGECSDIVFVHDLASYSSYWPLNILSCKMLIVWHYFQTMQIRNESG